MSRKHSRVGREVGLEPGSLPDPSPVLWEVQSNLRELGSAWNCTTSRDGTELNRPIGAAAALPGEKGNIFSASC